MTVPAGLRYTDEHEWVVGNHAGAGIGVTRYAVDQLGDIVFLELPDVGAQLKRGDAFGAVESVKAVSDLYAPLTGEVLEINQAAVDEPASINEDPYAVWLLRLAPSRSDELEALLDADAYRKLIGDA